MKKSILFIFFSVLSHIFAFELFSTSELLAAYLEKNSDIQTQAISYQQAQFSNQKNHINQGFSITLSSGSMIFETSADGNSFSISPAIKTSIPQAANLGINLSGNFTFSESGTSMEDSSVNVSLDIISASALERKISLLESERKVLEAKREFEAAVIAAEKEFYSTLSSLLSQVSSIISKQQDLYEDKIEFEEVKAKGYSEKSSNYRSAQMKVLSDQHEVEKAERVLKNEYTLFYLQCGKELHFDDLNDYMSLIPSDIPEVQPLEIKSFNPDSYTQVEKALWAQKIAELNRQTNKKFTLTANTGLTCKNSSASNKSTIDLGLSGTIGGLTISPEVYLPIAGGNFYPSASLEISLDPNKFRTDKIDAQIDVLDQRQELIDIESARRKLESTITEEELELQNILWEKTKYDEYYQTNKSLEEDMLSWYKMGVITESKYLSARVSREEYEVLKIINLIDMLLYNDTVSSYFYSDAQ